MARKSFPGSIRERSGSQVVRLSVAGQRFEYTLPDATAAEAREFARREHARLTDLHKRGVPLRYPMSKLIEEYEADHLETVRPRTRKGYEAELSAIRKYFVGRLRDPHIDKVRRRDVKAFLKWRRRHAPNGRRYREPLSPRSVQKARSILRTVFQVAVVDELLDANPCDGVPVKRPKRRPPVILEDAQAQALLDACRDSPKNPHLFPYVVALLETGARSQSEVLHLRWSDVDFDTGFVTIRSSFRHKTKDEETRHVPMTPLLHRTLQAHAAQYRGRKYRGKSSPWVFHHTRGRKGVKPGDRLRSVPSLKKARQIGLPDEWVPHDLRHRRVTTWLEAGHDISLVKDAVGHADIAMTSWYTHLKREHLKPLAADGFDYQEKSA